MEAAQVIAWKSLGELLTERGLVTPADLDSALTRQQETGALLGTCLVDGGALTTGVLTAVLAEQAGVSWKPLGRLLVERGLLTDQELDCALSQQAETGERLGEILVERRVVAGAVLTAILAEQAGVELEVEAGFGSGLFARLATRADDGGSPAPSRRAVRNDGGMPARPAAVKDEDPSFELIRLRSELELAHAQIAELEQENEHLRSSAARPRAARAKRSDP